MTLPSGPPPASSLSPDADAGRWLLLFGVWLLYASFGLVATSLAPLVSVIEADLGLSHAAMGSVMGAWQLVYIFAAVPCGILIDRIGARHALTIGACLIGLSALGRSMATGYVELIGSVMIFGIGGPIISAGAPKVVTGCFKGTSRGLAMGIYMTGPAIGGVVSLTLTHSWLLPSFDGDWRSVLRLWSVICVAGSAFWWLLASRRAVADEAQAQASGAPRAPQSVVIRELLQAPAVRLVLAMSVGLFLFNHGLNNWLPELLRAGGMGLIEAGYWAAIPTLIGIVASLFIPPLATPSRRFEILFVLCLAALTASLLLQADQPGALVPALLLQGIAKSTATTVLILLLVELPGIGDERAGTVSGLFFSAGEVGGVLGPLGLGLLYDTTGGFSAGLLMLSAISTLLAVSTLRLRALARRSERERRASDADRLPRLT